MRSLSEDLERGRNLPTSSWFGACRATGERKQAGAARLGPPQALCLRGP
jgi:hypothetical protein